MANLRTIQFLRNAVLYDSLAEAKSGLIAQAESLPDGSPIAGRYTVTVGDNEETRTILGMVASGSCSFFMNEEEINNILDNVVEGLEYSGITPSNATVVTNVTETDGIISATSENVGNLKLTGYEKGSESGSVASTDSINQAVAKLENQIDAANDTIESLNASSVSGDSKVVIDVTQASGQITTTVANITGVKLDGYAEGSDADIAATDTLGEALGKLQAQINAMDKDASAEDGKVVTTVTEVDGKVTETKANVKDLQLGGYAKTNDTGDIASADTINVALSKLENKAAAITIDNADGSINVSTGASGTDINVNIKSGEKVLAKDGDAGLYTNIAISAVTGTELTNLGTNVKEAYKLVATNGDKLGEYVKIYKDSALVDFFIGHVDDLLDGTTAQTEESSSSTVVQGTGDTALVYIMQLADGNYKLAAINVEDFIEEAEFASGVTWDNEAHKVKGVVDTESETNSGGTAFLTVGADGFKVSGIKQEIIDRINELDADLSGNTAHVTVGVKEVDGKLTAVTVAEDNIANADDLAELSAKTFTVATSSNASITTGTSTADDGTVSVDLITDASKINMSGFTGTSVLSGIAESDSIVDAFSKTEAVIEENESVASQALNDLNGRLDDLSGKSFTEIDSANNSITFTTSAATDGTVHVNAETDASKISGLTAFANTDEISGVTATDSVSKGIENLYASLAAEIEARKEAISATSVQGSDAIGVTQAASGDTISLILDDSTQGTGSERTGNYNALTITSDGLFLSTSWDCGTFD